LIPEAVVVDFIFELIRKGFAYKSDDGSIYFSIEKFKNYGKLAGIKKNDLKKDWSTHFGQRNCGFQNR